MLTLDSDHAECHLMFTRLCGIHTNCERKQSCRFKDAFVFIDLPSAFRDISFTQILSRFIIIVLFFSTFIRFRGLWNRSSYYEPRKKFWLTLTKTGGFSACLKGRDASSHLFISESYEPTVVFAVVCTNSIVKSALYVHWKLTVSLICKQLPVMSYEHNVFIIASSRTLKNSCYIFCVALCLLLIILL